MLWNEYTIQVIINLSLINNKKEFSRNIRSASLKLQCSERTIYRKLTEYEIIGMKAFIHGNKERTPANKKDLTLIEEFISKYKLESRNFASLSRCLTSNGLPITGSCLRKRMLAKNILSPSCSRKVRLKVRKLLKEKKLIQEALTTTETDLLEILENEGDYKKYYATKSRCKYSGERVEMDASSYAWFLGSSIKNNLHVVMDDATGFILGLWMDHEETLNGYYHIMDQMLTNHGIPYKIKTDKRTVFTYVKKEKNLSEKEKIDSERDALAFDTMTQFGYACNSLGIALTCSSDPRTKPRVERANKTLQGDLPNWLAIKGIRDIKSANKYIQETYIPYFNKTFGHTEFLDSDENKIKKVQSAFVGISQEDIKKALVIIEKRQIHQGHSISFKTQKYRLINENDRVTCLPPKSYVSIIRTLDDTELYATDPKGNCYILELIKNAKSYSSDLDPEEEKPIKKKVKYIYHPSKYHPWSWYSQQKFKEKDKLMKSFAHIYKDISA
jgi:hypothetical protein